MKAFYPGSFDPLTEGHLHVLQQASEIFDEVILGIAINSDKKKRIPEDEMLKAIEETLEEKNIKNVVVKNVEGLSAYYMRDNNIKYMVRGLRNGTDYEYEENIAKINEELYSEMQTIYFRAGKKGHISSSSVMAIFNLGGDISGWVSKSVLRLLEKLKKEGKQNV